MAKADYYLCDNCGEKAFYDSNVEYGGSVVVALCEDCANAGHRIVLQKASVSVPDQEPESLYKIMKEIAAESPTFYRESDACWSCIYCSSEDYFNDIINPSDHESGCPWRRLNEELARMEKVWAEQETPTIQLTVRIGEH